MNENITAKRLLTYADVCGMLNRNYKTIWAWVRDGKFPRPIKLNGQTLGWRQEDFENWLIENGN